ncbi:MAG: hypothetical protein IPL46_30970 [Saprospiraceae bacterium]|nr:hypothetical protein [Saprospiraceae bacterium]
MRVFTLLIVLTTFSFQAQGQTKEDIVNVIKAVSEVAELDPLFQVELSGGPTMVLLKNDRLSSGSNEVERNYFSLTNDDLWGMARPVQILTYQEADFEGVRRDMMVVLGLSFAGDQCNARFSCVLQEGNRVLEGWVSLNRDGFDWMVTGQNVRIR